MSKKEMNELELWLDEVGRARFTKETGRSHQTVHRACKNGKLPSGWYIATRDWCEKNIIECPEHLFDWNPPVEMDTNQNDYSEGVIQDALGK